MMETLDELVSLLEALAPEACLDDAELLQAALGERQRILSAVQSADMSSLSPEDRESIKGRLVAVLERDKQVLAQLEELRVELRKAQEKLVTGRAAVRGYGEHGSHPPPGVRRVG